MRWFDRLLEALDRNTQAQTRLADAIERMASSLPPPEPEEGQETGEDGGTYIDTFSGRVRVS